MSPIEPHRPAPAPEPAVPTPETAAAGARDRRRRFLRVSAGAVPLTMTLASRPVRAYTCSTSSAWGSAQVNPTASAAAHNAASALDVTATWTISQWSADSPTSAPWTALATALAYKPKGNSKNKGAALRKDYTLGDLFGQAGPFPGTLTAGQQVGAVLTSAGNTSYNSHLIVAKLNSMMFPVIAACLRSNGTDQLKEMMDGRYSPSNTTGPRAWTRDQIIAYLENNFIAPP